MSDHYCCKQCQQRYDLCKCDKKDNLMFSDLKGVHDIEKGALELERRNKKRSLADKIKTARQEYLELGSAKLNAAKDKAEELILKSISQGITSISVNVSRFDLSSNEERSRFESWLVENGVKCSRFYDQRDSDYYKWEIKV